MKQPKMIQETLIDDEDLSADIADLVPVSSKITDAAATYTGMNGDPKASSGKRTPQGVAQAGGLDTINLLAILFCRII